MIVLRSTMEAAVSAERQRAVKERQSFHAQYGEALNRTTALHKEMSAWVMNKADNITPEQAAQMFYAQDDTWQAAFFNVMQDQIRAYHAALPDDAPCAGVPAGEGQWYHAMGKLTREGFETIEAMYDHAKYHRERKDDQTAGIKAPIDEGAFCPACRDSEADQARCPSCSDLAA